MSATFKILFAGDSSVGKTTYLTRFRTGEFTNKTGLPNKPPIIGINITYLNLNTSKGKVKLEIWDCHTSKLELLNNFEMDAAVIMFDVTNQLSYNHIPLYYEKVTNLYPNISIVLCGNKVDCKNRIVNPVNIKFHIKFDLQYYDVSAKSNYNQGKPFLYLLRKLFNDETLCFIESKAVLSPEIF